MKNNTENKSIRYGISLARIVYSNPRLFENYKLILNSDSADAYIREIKKLNNKYENKI